MTALVLSIVLGAEVLSPTIVMPAVSGTPVQVAASPTTIDVVMANSDTYVVWADERRVQGLLTATAVLNPVADLWVRALDGGLAPSLVCPERSPALSTRLAATTTGRVGIAWRRGTAGELALSVLDPPQGSELTTLCGRQVATGARGRPAIAAVGESFRVAFETAGGVFDVVRDGGMSAPPAPLFPGCAQPSLAETPDGSWAAALCDGGLALRKGNATAPVTPEPTTAFTLVPELDGPGLLRVDGSGAAWVHAVASSPSMWVLPIGRGSAAVRAAVANESALLALWGPGDDDHRERHGHPDGQWRSGRSGGERPGRPVSDPTSFRRGAGHRAQGGSRGSAAVPFKGGQHRVRAPAPPVGRLVGRRAGLAADLGRGHHTQHADCARCPRQRQRRGATVPTAFDARLATGASKTRRRGTAVRARRTEDVHLCALARWRPDSDGHPRLRRPRWGGRPCEHVLLVGPGATAAPRVRRCRSGPGPVGGRHCDQLRDLGRWRQWRATSS
jgi:hypothetical protein